MKRFLLTSILCLFSATAFAESEPSPDPIIDECGGCPAGEICVTLEEASCPPCPGDGSDCTDECTTDERSYCEPAPPAECNSDADCGSGTVCANFNYTECGGGESPSPEIICTDEDGDTNCEDSGGGEDGAPGNDGDAEACSTYTENYCVPPYILGCEIDADCGAGFTCEQTEICECSGSTPGEDGEPVEDPVCSCEPSGDAQCQIIQVECDASNDCITGWTCESGPATPNCRDLGQDDGDGDVDRCGAPVEANNYCIPPAYEAWASGGVDGVSRATGNDDDLSSAERGEFFPVNTGNGTKADAGDGGCSTANGNGSGFALLLLGLFAFARRRREQR